jgi:hypothetical protein
VPSTLVSQPGIRASPIFHVGMHKTGSTWFQKRFYPKVEGHRFIHRRIVRSELLTHSPLNFDPLRARVALGLDEGLPAIICEEDLSGILHNGGLVSNYIAKEIARLLHSIAPEGRVVLFVRSQTSMAASCYQQYLREGGTESVHHYLFPEDYLHLGKLRPLKVPRFDFSPFEYDRLVAHYDSLFGRERVFVFPQEALARDAEAFLHNFCRSLDIAMPPGIDLTPLNASYRAGLIPIARFLNLFTRRAVADKRVAVHIPYWYPARKLALEGANRLAVFGPRPSARQLLGASTFEWIRQRFWKSNRELERRMDLDLGALGYATEPPPEPIQRPTRASFLRALST